MFSQCGRKLNKMMTKVEVLLLLIAILPTLNGYPLEEDGTTLEPSKEVKPNELKVHPLLSAHNDGQQKNNDNPKNNQSKEDDDSTESTYIEETYIEVLLPGIPQLNASALASLLNISVANSTHSTNSATEEQDSADVSSKKVNDRSTRDISSENDDDSKESDDSPKEKKSDLKQDSAHTSAVKTSASSSEKIVIPVLYSEKNVNDRPSRDTSSENDDYSSKEKEASSKEKRNSNKSRNVEEETESKSSDSDESSSEEQVNSQHDLIRQLYGKSITPRLKRSTDEKAKQDSEEKSSEKVVYVTPKNQNPQDTKEEP